MYKVKIFECSSEEAINKWLEKNTNIEIINIYSSHIIDRRK